MDAMIGQAPVLDCGAIVAHDALGPATFGTSTGLAVSLTFASDGRGSFHTTQEAGEDYVRITFFNANEAIHFNDFSVTVEGSRLHLLVMVVSAGPTGGAARQISYTLLEPA